MKRLGHYLIDRTLAQTVVSLVHLAKDEALNRPVVIKTFAMSQDAWRPPFTAEEWRQRFVAEGRIMAHLDHPNILGIHESGWIAPDRPYHILPFLPVPLARLIGPDPGGDGGGDSQGDGTRPRRLPVAEALRILRQLLTGLAYLHTRGIVHRNVAPGNILLGAKENGIVRLGDFGLARLGNGPDMKPGACVGTLNYISAEQQSDAGSVTDRADVYSAAAVGWRLLTGQPPPRPRSAAADAVPGLKPAIADLLDQALDDNPARRPDAARFARALAEPIVRSFTVRVVPATAAAP